MRIEKLILRKYPGLVGNFKRGYRDIVEMDFFEIENENVNELGFMDRLNIHAKTRGLISVEFTDEEMIWVEKAKNTETFEEVKELTKQIADWLREKNKNEKIKTIHSDREIDDEVSSDGGECTTDVMVDDLEEAVTQDVLERVQLKIYDDSPL